MFLEALNSDCFIGKSNYQDSNVWLH